MANKCFAAFARIAAIGLATCLSAVGAHAQSPLDNPDWQESDAPAPPAFNAAALLPLDMPRYVTLAFGVDPTTIRITPDGIVRYVVVAHAVNGSVTAFYEGILCARGEVKQYARTQSDGTWRVVSQAPWRALNDNQPSRHALAFARQGACDGSTAASSVADVVSKLKK